MSQNQQPYQSQYKIRIVTAASLFDGHDAAINIMRRIIQASGCEVIHLGHNRSVQEVVDCAIQEDVQGIAMTSYQGGHVEYLKYMVDLLEEKGCGHIKVFAGGGGVILPEEIEELHAHGIARVYSPDDGRQMGLQGMINDLVQQCDFATGQDAEAQIPKTGQDREIGRLISAAENFPGEHKTTLDLVRESAKQSKTPVLGITGTGGAGKSSLVDELVRRFLLDFKDKTIAIISVDPSKRKTGGALLGDRIRMNAIDDKRVYMRSLATRQSNLALSPHVQQAVNIVKAAGFDLVILETSGIGQSDTEIEEHSDVSMYVMTPEYGAATQLEKIDMLDFANIIAINKFDKRGALDALRDVQKQFQRNHQRFEEPTESMPVYGTIASQFNDPGTNELYRNLIQLINSKSEIELDTSFQSSDEMSEKIYIIPPKRTRYLAEIAENNRNYDSWVIEQAEHAQKVQSISNTIDMISDQEELKNQLANLLSEAELKLDRENSKILDNWESERQQYRDDIFTYQVRDKEIKVETHSKSLSEQQIPKISVPCYQGWSDRLKWKLQENYPGKFPYTAGVFPFKREGEDPTRMFAGEGGPERTNRRFHYVSKGMPAARLSTAFDSVTLYGDDPDYRPDIYGKIGNSGVSICCLDDAKKLYSGFRLTKPTTSVSMTINGPAPILVGFFMNAAIDQECEIYIKENGLEEDVKKKIAKIYSDKGIPVPTYQGEIPDGNDGLGLMLLGVSGRSGSFSKSVYETINFDTIQKVRGTVQADILKEDQAQNTCIFSTEFALRLMGDVQEYFIDKNVRNFYSVSISGYHIAEAGANPISQLAFTLANGFTFVEYYLARGMDINKFAPNFSFFFSQWC